MNRLKTAIALLILCYPLHTPRGGRCAQPDSAKAKTRQLKDFIQEVLKNGADKTIGAREAAGLGLKGAITTKAIRYRASITPDGKDHAFYVLSEKSTEGSLKPTDLIWAVTNRNILGADKYSEMKSFRSSPDGELEAASIGSGKVGKISISKLNFQSAQTKEAFAKENIFFMADAISLDYNVK